MKVEISCDHCGKKFWRSESRIRKNKSHNFCSRECWDAYKKINGRENSRYNRDVLKKLERLKEKRDEMMRRKNEI